MIASSLPLAKCKGFRSWRGTYYLLLVLLFFSQLKILLMLELHLQQGVNSIHTAVPTEIGLGQNLETQLGPNWFVMFSDSSILTHIQT